jgi:hypothetical protein
MLKVSCARAQSLRTSNPAVGKALRTGQVGLQNRSYIVRVWAAATANLIEVFVVLLKHSMLIPMYYLSYSFLPDNFHFIVNSHPIRQQTTYVVGADTLSF